MRPAHLTCRARHACPSAQACTSLCRSVSSTCSTSEFGSTRCLPTSKIRTERTKPLPLAADEPTSTFWHRAIFPTLETQAASCGSQWVVESPSSTASLSSGESLATSKKVFWIASRYFLSELPAADSFTKGKTQRDVSFSRLRSSCGCSAPAIGSGSASSAFGAGAAGVAAAGAGILPEALGTVCGVFHPDDGGGAAGLLSFGCADAANDTATTSANRALIDAPLAEDPAGSRSIVEAESRNRNACVKVQRVCNLRACRSGPAI